MTPCGQELVLAFLLRRRPLCLADHRGQLLPECHLRALADEPLLLRLVLLVAAWRHGQLLVVLQEQSNTRMEQRQTAIVSGRSEGSSAR